MHNLVALVTREWLEHRNTFLFPPAIILGLIIVAALFGSVVGEKVKLQIEMDSGDLNPQGFQKYERQPQAGTYGVSARPGVMPPRVVSVAQYNASSTLSDLAKAKEPGKLSGWLDGLSIPFFYILIMVSLSTAISSTYDERKDRSLLFWKSMPVDDMSTIIGKFIFIAWIAPLATIAGIVIARFLTVGVASVYSDELAFGDVWGDPSVWTGLFGVLTGYLMLGLWIAPIYAWLMLVGSVVPRSPMLIGLITPLIVFWLEWQFFGTTHILAFASTHIAPKTMYSHAAGFTGQVDLLMSQNFGIGIAVAALLLAGTVYARQRFNEV